MIMDQVADRLSSLTTRVGDWVVVDGVENVGEGGAST